jgi:hypothetical protein
MSAKQHAAGLLLRRIEVGNFQSVAQRRAAGAAGRHGGDLTPSPEGLRQLSPAEKAINETWRWSTDLATWVCDSHPNGIQS